MYGTIEPRLIALLNGEPDDASSSAAVGRPPLHDTSSLPSSSTRLLPLEPDGSPPSNPPNATRAAADALCTSPLDVTSARDPMVLPTSSPAAAARARTATASESLRKILDVDAEPEPSPTAKRQARVKDDFVQLPQPPKKQKTVPPQVVPPIIIGLFEPPPNAALFPPIASSSFHDSRGRNALNVAETGETETSPTAVRSLPKAKKKQPKSRVKGARRRRWEDEETKHLLLGVYKHGVGKWTRILQDPEFKFNDRKAVDLKDRFRTCCPTELRGKEPTSSPPPGEKSDKASEQDKVPEQPKGKSRLLCENLLIDEYFFGAHSNSEASDEDQPERPKRRVHRKKLEDLVELGIDGFKPSERRQRRPFNDEEDRNILLGFGKYGSAWSTIQKDPALGLQSRRPTDIRDRLRNMNPAKFRQANCGRKHNRTEAAAARSVVRSAPKPRKNPSVTYAILPRPPAELSDGALNNKLVPVPLTLSFRDIMADLADPPVPADDPLAMAPPFDWTSPFANSVTDSDISRLLLVDSWAPALTAGGGGGGSAAPDRQRQSHDLHAACTTAAEAAPRAPQPFFFPNFELPGIPMPPPSTLDHGHGFGQ